MSALTGGYGTRMGNRNLRYHNHIHAVKKAYTYIIPFLIILLLGSCSHSKEQMKNKIKSRDHLNTVLMQHQDDLLAGTSKAVCYSGFRSGQHPDRGYGANNPSDEEILEDLIILSTGAGFKLIRLYDSGSNSESVLRIIRDEGLDIKVMLGIWLSAELSNHESCEWLTEPIPAPTLESNRKLNISEIVNGIKLADEYQDIVVAVNIGNEALVDWNDHRVDVDTLITYVRRVKKEIKQPVTVAENYEWWASRGAKLANELDFISVHTYPAWEGKTIDEALSYSIENILKVYNGCPGSRIVISEAGWASEASEFGDMANESNQARYYNEIMKWSEDMNITTFFFEAFDEDWKGDPANSGGAEKHWGLYTVGRQPKLVMKDKTV